ncbi:hypothetical protein CJ030_MR5G004824 [Morella rubra]|uniref:GH18 domain-containing protein n=1 Tax=Morella rubra TaxID=262757 RepID=A0A6A1VIV4_9ROSI|nr:hypothetical protein CJ030_MR5G004824 [Morella rubra]
MASLNFAHFLSIAYSLFFIGTAGAVTDSAPVVKGGYYPSWAFENFPPSAIDTSLFTHIYAFLVPNSITFRLDIANTTETLKLHHDHSSKNPHVKALYSIGGRTHLCHGRQLSWSVHT